MVGGITWNYYDLPPDMIETYYIYIYISRHTVDERNPAPVEVVSLSQY